jgi:4-amino-4-deoxy-L-arabinose transferase-like glycosyltransferase
MAQPAGFSTKNTAFLFLIILLVRTVPVFAVYRATGSAVLNPFELDPILYLGGAGSILTTGINEFSFFAPLNFLYIAGLLYLGGGNALAPVLVTAFVGWLTVVVLYALSRELFDEKSAIIAAILAGLYPNFIFYGMNLYPETLAMFFIVSSFYFMVTYFKTGRLVYVVSAGIVWGLTSQTRGGLHFFSLGLCLAAMLHFRHNGWLYLMKPAGALLLSIYSAILLISLMAAPFHGGLAFNSQSGMGSVLHGANRLTNCNQDYGVVRGALLNNVYDAGEDWPEGSQVYSDELMEQSSLTIMAAFFRFVKEDPLHYLRNGFERLSFMWSPNQLIIKNIKLRFHYRSPMLTTTLCLALTAVFLVVLCCGILGFSIARDPLRPLFLLFVLFYCVLIFCTVGNAKLRLPLMPLFMLYAGHFWMLVFSRKFVCAKFSAAAAGVLCILVVLNGIYRYQDIVISPGEVNVRQIEMCADLGFPQTAIFLIEKNKYFHHYTGNQLRRLSKVERRVHQERDQK